MVDTPCEDRILRLRQVRADRITSTTADAFTYYISADRSAKISRLWCRPSLISAHAYLYRHLDRNHEMIRSSKLPRQFTGKCKFEFRFTVVVQFLKDSLATLNWSYISLDKRTLCCVYRSKKVNVFCYIAESNLMCRLEHVLNRYMSLLCSSTS